MKRKLAVDMLKLAPLSKKEAHEFYKTLMEERLLEIKTSLRKLRAMRTMKVKVDAEHVE